MKLQWHQIGDLHPEDQDICLVDRGERQVPMVATFVVAGDDGLDMYWQVEEGDEYEADEFDVWAICPRKDI